MSDTQAEFGIAIVGDNKVEKGAKAAEKRLAKVPEHAAKAGKKFTAEAERSVGGMSKGILRAFTGVEQAGAKAFGGRSLTSGLTSQMGALGKAGSAVGTGLGEATAGAGLFETAIGAVGVAVAGTIGIVAAAGYAAFKLADGWAKGAASIGRTAEIIGVGTKALQEFGAAAERAGVDKDKATGALGGLSENLNDARYGRNNQALAVLGRLGVAMKTNADGTVDIGSMLPQIADAIARQNSSGRRTAARALGIPIDTLLVFTQGGKRLASDMKDADAHAVVITDGQIATGRRLQRKGAMVGQLKDQAVNAAGRTVAEAAEPGYDAVLSGATAISDGTVGKVAGALVARGGAAIERGGAAIERAAIGLTSAVIGVAQRVSARHHQYASVALGQYGVESSYGRHMPAGSNNPFGIKARAGEPFVLARTREEDRAGRSYYTMAKFRKFGSIEDAFEAHARVLDGRRYARARGAESADEFADDLTGVYATDRHYGSKLKGEMHRRGLERFDGQPIPVRVEVEMRGAPPGTRTKVTAGHRSAPAVSHAYQPSHGG